MEQVVTVGLDGTPHSMAAARWAAGEAHRRGATLHLLHAWVMLSPGSSTGPAESDQNYWAKRIVHDMQTELRREYPALPIVEDLVAEEAPAALLNAAARSAVLVLGSRGLDRVESFFLGDTSLYLVGRADRPVVLVRAEERTAQPEAAGRAGPVVLGVSLHGPGDALLEFAFETAAERGVELRAVHGRSLPAQAYAPWGVDPDVAAEIQQDAEIAMGRMLSPWREKFPGVQVAETIRLESPARALIRAAEEAELLLIGRRRHHTAMAPRLGPVAQAAVHHASCPVAVVAHD